MPVDLTIVLELIAFAVLMGLSAFFSSSETALFSLSQLQLEQMRRVSDPQSTLIERLLSQPRHLIVTILIGNELVNVAASVISAAIVIQMLGSEHKWVNLLIMVPVLLLVGEITPKTLAIRNNMAFARFQCRFIDLFARTISPLRWIVRHVSELFITLIVGKERSRANIITEDMVRSLAQEAVGDGALDREEAHYINRIFDFGERVVRDVMTPRSQIHFLPASATLDDAALDYHRSGHTKFPVRGESQDSIVGVIYVRDLLQVEPGTGPLAQRPGTVAEVMRKAFFVAETKSVADLFYTFRKRKLSLALTIDEYGGVTGLVTMENLLECIFGDIMSRSELLRERALSMQEVGENAFRVDGAMTIQHFNRLMGSNLESHSIQTVGGLLLSAFGELPSESSCIVVDGFEFAVDELADQRVASVTVKLIEAPEELLDEGVLTGQTATTAAKGPPGSSLPEE